MKPLLLCLSLLLLVACESDLTGPPDAGAPDAALQVKVLRVGPDAGGMLFDYQSGTCISLDEQGHIQLCTPGRVNCPQQPCMNSVYDQYLNGDCAASSKRAHWLSFAFDTDPAPAVAIQVRAAATRTGLAAALYLAVPPDPAPKLARVDWLQIEFALMTTAQVPVPRVRGLTASYTCGAP